MHLLGFLLILPLYGDNFKSLFENVNNYSIEVQKVGVLAEIIFKSNETSDAIVFTEDDIREANFVKKGKVAKYYSKSLRDYVVSQNVSSDVEGFVVTLHDLNKTSISYLYDANIENNHSKTPTVIFIPNQGVCVNCLDKKALSSLIAAYIETALKSIDNREIGVLKNSTENYASVVGDDDVIANTLNIEPINNNETSVLEELSKRIVNVGKFSDTTDSTKSNMRNDLNEKKNYSESKQQTDNLQMKSIDLIGLNTSTYNFSTLKPLTYSSIFNRPHNKSISNIKKVNSKGIHKIQSMNHTQTDLKNHENKSKINERNDLMDDISTSYAFTLFEKILKLFNAKSESDQKSQKSVLKKNDTGNNTILKIHNQTIKKLNTSNYELPLTTQLMDKIFNSTGKSEQNYNEDEFLEDSSIPSLNTELPEEQIRDAHITETFFQNFKNKTSSSRSDHRVNSKLEPMLSEIIRMTPPNFKNETDIQEENQLLDRYTLPKIMTIKQPYFISQKTVDFNPKPKWNQEKSFGINNANESKNEPFTLNKKQLPEEAHKIIFHNKPVLGIHRNESKDHVFDYNSSNELKNSQSTSENKPKFEIFSKEEFLNYINEIKKNITKIIPEEISKSIHNGKILKFYRRMNKSLPFDIQKRNEYNSKIEPGVSRNTDFKDHIDTADIEFDGFFSTELDHLSLKNYNRTVFVLDHSANQINEKSLDSDKGIIVPKGQPQVRLYNQNNDSNKKSKINCGIPIITVLKKVDINSDNNDTKNNDKLIVIGKCLQ